MRGLPPKFQYFYMSGAEAHNSKGEIVSERSSERPSTKKASSWLPRYVKPTLPSFPSCRECWDLACWGTGRNACATGRREFKRAGPANTIGTRTARRMPFVSQDEPALRGKTAASNQRRHGFLLVVTAGIWRVGAQTSFSRAPAGAACATGRREGQWAAAAASFLRWSSISWKKASSFIFCSGVIRARIFSRLCWRICSFWASAGA